MKKYILILVLISSALIGINKAGAATEINSYIDEDLHLTKEGSPYEVTGDNGVYVAPGNMVSIDPGVTVLFSGGWLYLDHSDIKIGDSAFSEKITMDKKSAGATWSGIYIDGGKADISSLEINNASSPIFNWHGNTTISSSKFDGGGIGFRTGIYSMAGSLNVSSSSISHFTNRGIYAEDTSGHLLGNAISINGIGLFYNSASSKSFSGTKNIFSENPTHIFNVSESTTLNFKGNDWGSGTGTPPLEGSVNGKVITGHELTKCCSSVVFLPGLMGTRLLKGDNQLWEPNVNADVEKLYMDGDGNSVDGDIEVGEIIDKTNVLGPLFSQRIYQSFIEKMDEMVTNNKIASWQALPYDWRLDTNDIVEIGDFVSKIENVASTSMTGKVTIVAHSNGGLVAKKLVSHLSSMRKAGMIDDVILVASPQIGTPDAVKAVLHGDNFGFPGSVLSRKNARQWGENLPVAYNLLPLDSYLSTVIEPVVTFDSSLDKINSWRSTYGDSISSESEIEDFLLGREGRSKPAASDTVNPNILNESLLGTAKDNHSNFDHYTFPSSDVFQIVGWGQGTPSALRYFASTHCGLFDNLCLDHDVALTNDGDGTVVTPSASAYQNASSTYFVNMKEINENLDTNYKHASILETPAVLDLVEELVTNQSSGVIEGVSNEKPESVPFVNLEISVHSPVNIHAYDAKGNHTGIVSSQGSDLIFVEEEIPNSSYAEVGEGKYINVQDSKPVTLKLEGSAVGSFTLDIERKEDGYSPGVIQFVDIPVTDVTRGKINITSLASTTLSLDTNGDNVIDIRIKPNSEADPLLYLEILKLNIKSFKLKPTIEKLLIKKIDKVIKLITKDKEKIAVKKLSKLSNRLENKNWNLKKISENNRTEIVAIINEIIDTL
jgi:hypothetical protein